MDNCEDARKKPRAATAREKASNAQRYKRVTAKITAYQQGTGPAPTLADFRQWKEDVDVDVALRKLHAGQPRLQKKV